MRFKLNVFICSCLLSSMAVSQELKNDHKLICESISDEQPIKLEFFINDNFKDFPTKKDKVDIDLRINDEIFTETLSYPKYRIEQELNDEGLAVVFLTASLHRPFAQCLFKSCSIKNLSFNIESTNLYDFTGNLFFELNVPRSNKKQYNLLIDCHLF